MRKIEEISLLFLFNFSTNHSRRRNWISGQRNCSSWSSSQQVYKRSNVHQNTSWTHYSCRVSDRWKKLLIALWQNMFYQGGLVEWMRDKRDERLWCVDQVKTGSACEMKFLRSKQLDEINNSKCKMYKKMTPHHIILSLSDLVLFW